jgi:hypothetical protein
MNFWRDHLEQIIQSNDGKLLVDKGSISHQEMEEIMDQRYENFDQKRKERDAQQADREDLETLKQIEKKIRKKSS